MCEFFLLSVNSFVYSSKVIFKIIFLKFYSKYLMNIFSVNKFKVKNFRKFNELNLNMISWKYIVLNLKH